MGFTADTPVVAGVVLIRSAIQSPNYVVNVSGWTINQDGSVEFNNAVIRGELDVNGASGAYIRIFAFGGAVPVIQMRPSDFADPTYNFATIGLISTDNNTTPVHNGRILLLAPGYGQNAGIKITGDSYENGFVDSGIDLQTASVTKNGNDMGGGWIAGGGLTASATAVNGTETTQITALTAAGTTPTFLANRVYRMESSGGATTGAVATSPLFRYRKTNPAGQQLDVFRCPCVNTGTTYPSNNTSYFKVGASDIAANIVLTLQGAVAPGTVQLTAAASSPAYFHIYEDGTAASRPWAATLV